MSKKTYTIAHELCDITNYDAVEVVKVFLDALTDLNYHKERTLLTPLINKIFKTKLHLKG